MEAEATETRRFGLADLMILVVGTAVGLAPLKTNWNALKDPQIWPLRGWGVAAYEKTNLFLACVSPMLLSLTIASLVLAARRPRLPLGRMARRPGFVLCLAPLAGFAHAATITLAGYLEYRQGLDPQARQYDDIWVGGQYLARVTGPQNAGMATLGAWVAVVCCGLPWRAADWRDRLGRVMGAGWLVLLLATYARDLSPHLVRLMN
jgi:hypothetical protein